MRLPRSSCASGTFLRSSPPSVLPCGDSAVLNCGPQLPEVERQRQVRGWMRGSGAAPSAASLCVGKGKVYVTGSSSCRRNGSIGIPQICTRPGCYLLKNNELTTTRGAGVIIIDSIEQMLKRPHSNNALNCGTNNSSNWSYHTLSLVYGDAIDKSATHGSW